MSYDIELYRKEVKEKAQAYDNALFWENEANILPFTPKHKELIHKWLLDEGYLVTNETDNEISYEHEADEAISATLTKRTLYLSTTSSDTFDLDMLASKLVLTGKFAKFNPQSDEWEGEDEE